MMESDVALLDKWRGGDKAAGRDLFDRYFDLVCRFFRSKVGDDADDLVQQTFLRCVNSRDRVRDGSMFRGYVLAVARSVMVDYIRKRTRAPEIVDASVSSLDGLAPSPSRLLSLNRNQQLLLQALRRVPLDTQILLELSYWEELSSREIGEVLGVPAPTIRSRLKRATTELKSVLTTLASDPSEAEKTFRGLSSWAAAVRAQLE